VLLRAEIAVGRARERSRRASMMDLFYFVVILALFASSIWMLRAFDRM
jgi:hypothetical protein